MFSPSQKDVRNFFFAVMEKQHNSMSLTDLEKIALSIILEHAEYAPILNNRDKYLDYQWTVDMGQTNPFLHLSMHMSIIEQLSIDQPAGIKALFSELCKKFQDQHRASHELMECLGEMLWQAQANNTPPDIEIYFSCINNKLGK